jgi:hypothetical protein
MKMAVSWDVVPRSVVEIRLHFRGAYDLCHQDSKAGFVFTK